MKSKESSWTLIRLCINCDEELSRYEYVYSNGACPYCGAYELGTFVKVKSKNSSKGIYIHPKSVSTIHFASETKVFY